MRQAPRPLLAITLLLTLTTTTRAQPPTEAARAILNNIMADEPIPALSAAVWHNGNIVFSEALGTADIEQRTPASPHTRFRLASVSKAFTGTLVARLHEQDRVDVDADIRDDIPDFPEKQGVVTIRHLLAHAGGIRHYLPKDRDQSQPAGSIDRRTYRTTADALAIFIDDPLIGPPGGQRAYSTFGFTLIAAALEGATGKPFLTLLREEIFEPLQLTTVSPDRQRDIIPDRTGFYSLWNGDVVNATPMNPAYKWAGGGLLASAPDLARFGSAHCQPGFLRAETLDTMFTRQELNDGRTLSNGFAWDIATDDHGRRIVQHSGNQAGSRAMLIVWPDHDTAAAILTNLSGKPRDISTRTRAIGQLFLDQQTPTTPTTPTANTTAIDRIAFGSCAKQNRPQPIWHTIADHEPDVFLFIGDNIYGDTRDMNVLRDKYAALDAKPGYQKLKAECTILATWDDHDYGENDAGNDYPMRDESQQIFLDFYGEPEDSDRRTTPGVYDASISGPPGKRVQFILLDTRYFRDPLLEKQDDNRRVYVPTTDNTTTILGEAQWTWLREQLTQPAEIRIIASSIQVVSQQHRWEKWENFPHERRRLFQLIDDTNANGVVFISGDRHQLELSCDRTDVPYPLYDFTSSGMNQRDAGIYEEPNRHRVCTARRSENFGLIHINWNDPTPTITFDCRATDNQPYFQHTIRLDELQQH